MNDRRPTRQISLGNDHTGIVRIGGDAPVAVQTMTAGYTWDIDACVAEINRMTDAGADVVRVAVPQAKDTEALPEILNQTRVPIVADVLPPAARITKRGSIRLSQSRTSPIATRSTASSTRAVNEASRFESA